MHANRCSRGIAGVIVVLCSIALLFDDVMPAAAAAVLLIFLGYRYLTFSGEISRIAASLSVQREITGTLVREGAPVRVTTSVVMPHPVSLRLAVTDLPPDGTLISAGDRRGAVQAADAGPCILRYAFRAATVGENRFRGVKVSFSDPFFRTDLVFGRDEYREPRIRVFPARIFQYEPRDLFGDDEIERRTPVPGVEIRSFRDYAEGDDLKHIDWKLSAKCNKTIIREYMGREGRAPLLIVDLPDRTNPLDRELFGILKERVSGILISEMEKEGEVSIAVISGSNLIRFLPQEREFGRAMQVVQEMAPADRLHHLYRAGNAGVQFERFAKEVRESGGFRNDTLQEAARDFRRGRGRTLFETQMAGIMTAVPASDILVFSLPEGDTSHLRLIAEIARDLHRKARLSIPRDRFTPPVRSRIAPYPYDGLEVVP